MKTKIFQILFLTFFTSILHAQWNSIDSITLGSINAIHFINVDTGFVHGEQAVMRRTLNGGQTWDTMDIKFSGFIHDIDFASANVGYAVGGAWFPFGTHYPFAIVKTVDGGLTWDSIYSGTNGGVFDYVEVVTDDIFYATSTAGMVHSDDGGATFDTIYIPGLPMGAEQYNRVRFVNPSKGYVLGKANFFVGYLTNLYETNDSGKTWQSIYVDSITNFTNDFVMTETGKGILVGNGSYVKRTIDTGATWQTIALADTNLLLYKIEEVDGHLYAQGSDAADTTSGLYYSPDWGSTWQKQFSVKAKTGGIVDLSIPTSKVGYFVTWRNVYKNDQLISLLERAMLTYDFELYPNPAEGEVSINLETNSNGDLRVYNALGQEVLFSSFEQSSILTVNIGDLNRGVYFVELTIDGEKAIKKLIKN